jgi:membrane peptidoglycan carboxypeptidase
MSPWRSILPWIQPSRQKMEQIEAGNDRYVLRMNDLQEMGAITENNQTGEVVGIGGGRNYVSGGSMLLNHATDQYKQPGSSVKPFLDYAPTFDYLGWATDHVIVDKAGNVWRLDLFQNAIWSILWPQSLSRCIIRHLEYTCHSGMSGCH